MHGILWGIKQKWCGLVRPPNFYSHDMLHEYQKKKSLSNLDQRISGLSIHDRFIPWILLFHHTVHRRVAVWEAYSWLVWPPSFFFTFWTVGSRKIAFAKANERVLRAVANAMVTTSSYRSFAEIGLILSKCGEGKRLIFTRLAPSQDIVADTEAGWPLFLYIFVVVTLSVDRPGRSFIK